MKLFLNLPKNGFFNPSFPHGYGASSPAVRLHKLRLLLQKKRFIFDEALF
jgi:hypothetical protein